MNTNAGADAFISYSNQDKEFVLRLTAALESRGLRLASALQVITTGAWREQIMEALEIAPTLLFVLSADSIRDSSCLEELRRAEELKKRIIPIYYRLHPTDDLSVNFQAYSGVDFTEETQFDAGVAQLLAALSSAPQEAQRNAPTAGWVLLKRISENSTVPEEDPATIALARLLAKAASINQHFETNFDVTFSSMLLAFLACDDALSQWFRNYVAEAKVEVGALLKQRNLDPEKLAAIASQVVTENELSRIWRQTVSARNLFAAGREFLQRTSPAQPTVALDVRHLMGAYIYRPVGHEGDLVSLKYNRIGWSNGFLGQMARLFPQELDAWKQIHQETFPDNPPEPFVEAKGGPEPVQLNGPSTHIARDLWTTEDALGYRAYAYAIYRFMTHPQTKPPLTISIQAPWGGGKTSLMRMIQKQLDPKAFADAAAEAEQTRGEIRLKDVLTEIRKWTGARTRFQELLSRIRKPKSVSPLAPDVPANPAEQCLTIWFNAWKYENTNQVWAGLVDAIMHQVAARLPLAARERFWLQLHFRRIDMDRLRHKIYERILRYWWRWLWLWFLSGAAAVMGALWLFSVTWAVPTQLLYSALGGGMAALLKLLKAHWEVKEEPAAVSLKEYLDIPDYSKELGFIHQAEADLRRVLASLPTQHKRLVVFIDDLDRCSPAKVAQVVEAVNLFLAGDFQNCMFVMGMDAEMVAAALQAAHKDMIAHLPEDAGIPVGWRFMDKFVQLPFLIPPAMGGTVSSYTRALFATDGVALVDAEAERLAQEAAARLVTRPTSVAKDYDEEVAQLRTRHNLSEERTVYVRKKIEAQVVQQRLDDGFEKFNDRNPEIIHVIETATKYFSGNPREMKRFVNAFRFHFFLWWAQRAQGLLAPSLEQLTRWTVLCMRWPEVVRWLRRGGGNELVPAQEKHPTEEGYKSVLTFQSRLHLLEELSGKSQTLTAWHEGAKNDLRLNVEKTPWLSDDDLFQFFRDEQEQPDGHRLSAGAGRGLW